MGLLAHVRAEFGEEIELLHDVHERLSPNDAVQFAKDVEQFKLLLGGCAAPGYCAWFERIRQQTSTPLAMGELFNHPLEWQPLIANRQIDFLRMHMSQMGGITPAKRVAGFADLYGVRTAWHGPSDTSPVGHAANLHLDPAGPNFGIQEWYRPKELDYEIFPGLPEVRDGDPDRTTAPAWASTSTKNWPPAIRAKTKLSTGPKPACPTARLRDHKGVERLGD